MNVRWRRARSDSLAVVLAELHTALERADAAEADVAGLTAVVSMYRRLAVLRHIGGDTTDRLELAALGAENELLRARWRRADDQARRTNAEADRYAAQLTTRGIPLEHPLAVPVVASARLSPGFAACKGVGQ